MTTVKAWRPAARLCRSLGYTASFRREIGWSTMLLFSSSILCLLARCGPLDPVINNIVYQGRSETGTVVSVETLRCGTDDKPQGDVGSPTFVIAQADGTLITLRPSWPPSPACYEAVLTSPDGRESRLPLREVYREYVYPDPSVYRGRLLPTSQPASRPAATQPAAK